MRREISIGDRYGNYVIEYAIPAKGNRGRRVGCVCDCGQKTEMDFGDLARRKNKTCLCSRKWVVGSVGKKFGKLTVIELLEPTDTTTHTLARCKCECGTVLDVESRRLKTKTHCGCQKLDPLVASYRQLIWNGYKYHAKSRGYEWELTEEECIRLFSMPCYYCGIEPYREFRYEHGESFLYNGIDRVNNEIGYKPANVVPCCRECNIAKGAMPFEAFIGYIERLSKNFITKEKEFKCQDTTSLAIAV